MREIKYRAYDKKRNKIVTVESIEFIDPIEGRTGYNVFIAGEKPKKAYWLEWNDAILLQYTGLKDKNGKEIYEGDKFKNDDDDDYEYFIVEWDNAKASFKINGYGYNITIGEGSQEVYDEYISLIDDYVFNMDFLSEYEIIGNIHLQELCV